MQTDNQVCLSDGLLIDRPFSLSVCLSVKPYTSCFGLQALYYVFAAWMLVRCGGFFDPPCHVTTEPQLLITSRKHNAWLHTHSLKSPSACCRLSNPGLNLMSRNHCTWHADWFWNNSSAKKNNKKKSAIKVNNILSLALSHLSQHWRSVCQDAASAGL